MTIEQLPQPLQKVVYNNDIKLIGRANRVEDRGATILLFSILLFMTLPLGLVHTVFLLNFHQFDKLPILVPIILLYVFLAAVRGLIYLMGNFYLSGPYFVLTNKELVLYQKERLEIIHWQNFTEKINITKKNQYSDIQLTLKTGKFLRNKHRYNYKLDTINLYHVSKGEHFLATSKTLILEHKNN